MRVYRSVLIICLVAADVAAAVLVSGGLPMGEERRRAAAAAVRPLPTLAASGAPVAPEGPAAPTPAEPPLAPADLPTETAAATATAEPPSTSTPEPTTTATGTATPTSSPTATPPSTVTPRPTATVPTATPAPGVVTVANTGGQPVNLRRAPRAGAEVVRSVREGTTLVVVGQSVDTDGQPWLNVRDSEGNTGWMLARYLVPIATATPSATPRP